MLMVSYGGTKAFRAVTYSKGLDKDGRPVTRPNTIHLGTYPRMTLKEAREKVREYFDNPEKVRAEAAVGSFKEVAEQWIRRHVEANRLRSRNEIKRQLNEYVYPKWQTRPFLEIRRREVNDLLDHIADHHGRSQADAMLATIRSIMTWHQSRDEDYVTPIVREMRRNKANARKRTLNDAEIKKLWQAIAGIENEIEQAGNGQMPWTFGALIKTLLVTAQRKDKVASMRWDDLADGIWTIRAEEREKGTAGAIELPQMALQIVERQPRMAGNPHVFAARGKGPFNSFSQRKEELDAKLGDMPGWTLHDLRRTARSLMSRAGVRPDIAERVLGHAIPGVEGVYDRHEYREEKADALRKLASLIKTIVNPPVGNVHSLADRRAAQS